MGIVGSAVYVAVILSAIVDCVYFMHCLFVTLLISSCHHSYYQRILINSLASSPGLYPAFPILHAEKRATLKTWEWPGDEATT